QPLWIPGLAPILLAVIIVRRRLSWTALYVATSAAVITIVKLSAPPVLREWNGPPMGNAHLVESLPLVARQIYVYFTGSYYFGWSVASPGPATTATAIIWCVLLASAALVQGYRLATKQHCALSHLLFAAVCATLAAEWLLLPARDARYMLPLEGLL